MEIRNWKLKEIFDDRKFGGGNRDRTCDIQLAKLALSQLSYAPTWEMDEGRK
jgi:hypothetical protein